ncbi:hypothetical protein [Rosellinia necatrix megabirnavirus 2-W8]|uniref:Uncharacterized protein n=1 Tax=Rosellinia necatrix megabirnavirus 2-W8 TaxID=1676267 RepID=A0A0U5AK39_9VIRU|nr:hypothetical protein [Rosellinia necatrix megabirnavirus 2-W8]BAU24263.1 hypothetical protein [Rosellinia necatrix megabirnavirus 2-W8]
MDTIQFGELVVDLAAARERCNAQLQRASVPHQHGQATAAVHHTQRAKGPCAVYHAQWGCWTGLLRRGQRASCASKLMGPVKARELVGIVAKYRHNNLGHVRFAHSAGNVFHVVHTTRWQTEREARVYVDHWLRNNPEAIVGMGITYRDAQIFAAAVEALSLLPSRQTFAAMSLTCGASTMPTCTPAWYPSDIFVADPNAQYGHRQLFAWTIDKTRPTRNVVFVTDRVAQDFTASLHALMAELEATAVDVYRQIHGQGGRPNDSLIDRVQQLEQRRVGCLAYVMATVVKAPITHNIRTFAAMRASDPQAHAALLRYLTPPAAGMPIDGQPIWFRRSAANDAQGNHLALHQDVTIGLPNMSELRRDMVENALSDVEWWAAPHPHLEMTGFGGYHLLSHDHAARVVKGAAAYGLYDAGYCYLRLVGDDELGAVILARLGYCPTLTIVAAWAAYNDIPLDRVTKCLRRSASGATWHVEPSGGLLHAISLEAALASDGGMDVVGGADTLNDWVEQLDPLAAAAGIQRTLTNPDRGQGRSGFGPTTRRQMLARFVRTLAADPTMSDEELVGGAMGATLVGLARDRVIWRCLQLVNTTLREFLAHELRSVEADRLRCTTYASKAAFAERCALAGHAANLVATTFAEMPVMLAHEARRAGLSAADAMELARVVATGEPVRILTGANGLPANRPNGRVTREEFARCRPLVAGSNGRVGFLPLIPFVLAPVAAVAAAFAGTAVATFTAAAGVGAVALGGIGAAAGGTALTIVVGQMAYNVARRAITTLTPGGREIGQDDLSRWLGGQVGQYISVLDEWFAHGRGAVFPETDTIPTGNPLYVRAGVEYEVCEMREKALGRWSTIAVQTPTGMFTMRENGTLPLRVVDTREAGQTWEWATSARRRFTQAQVNAINGMIAAAQRIPGLKASIRQDVAPGASGADSAMAARVLALEQTRATQDDLAAAVARITALEARPTGDTDLRRDLDAATARITELEQRQPADLRPLEARVARLEEELREVRDRVHHIDGVGLSCLAHMTRDLGINVPHTVRTFRAMKGAVGAVVWQQFLAAVRSSADVNGGRPIWYRLDPAQPRNNHISLVNEPVSVGFGGTQTMAMRQLSESEVEGQLMDIEWFAWEPFVSTATTGQGVAAEVVKYLTEVTPAIRSELATCPTWGALGVESRTPSIGSRLDAIERVLGVQTGQTPWRRNELRELWVAVDSIVTGRGLREFSTATIHWPAEFPSAVSSAGRSFGQPGMAGYGDLCTFAKTWNNLAASIRNNTTVMLQRTAAGVLQWVPSAGNTGAATGMVLTREQQERLQGVFFPAAPAALRNGEHVIEVTAGNITRLKRVQVPTVERAAAWDAKMDRFTVASANPAAGTLEWSDATDGVPAPGAQLVLNPLQPAGTGPVSASTKYAMALAISSGTVQTAAHQAAARMVLGHGVWDDAHIRALMSLHNAVATEDLKLFDVDEARAYLNTGIVRGVGDERGDDEDACNWRATAMLRGFARASPMARERALVILFGVSQASVNLTMRGWTIQ